MKLNTMSYFWRFLLLILIVITTSKVYGFCGFYTSRASSKLYNSSSQVIIARKDNTTVLTMESDFKGDVQEFAMVVPVPEVLKRDQIRVLENNSVFERLDAFTGPRLVEYFDPNPCTPPPVSARAIEQNVPAGRTKEEKTQLRKSYGITIEAEYLIGEYSIIILSATESDGLMAYLKNNHYKLPDGAEEVLEPYIKSKLKFFVVKVNLKALKTGASTLRPLQIKYTSERFMLPIRLGMANAKAEQDLTIYILSQKGRVQCSNYKTLDMPTNKTIPMGIHDHKRFSPFYAAVFNKFWSSNKNAVFTEHFWDISGKNFMKCDPCPVDPPYLADLLQAGVFWLDYDKNNMHFNTYDGDLFVTRLHARYSRASFPEDLMFQETPSRENFQVRFIITHDAKGDLNCKEGKTYLETTLPNRKKEELENLRALSGWLTASTHDRGPQKDVDDDFFTPFWLTNADDWTNWIKIVIVIMFVITLFWGLKQLQRVFGY